MGVDDIVTTARRLPASRFAVVHMEALNHCALTRAELRSELQAQGLADRVVVPDDESVVLF